MKNTNMALLILLIAVAAIVSLQGNLLPANVLGNSQIEMQLGVDSDVSSSYWVLTTAETKVSSTDFISKTDGTQLSAGSTSESGEGVTADGEAAKAAIQAQYFYNLDAGTLGYTTHIVKDTTPTYINSYTTKTTAYVLKSIQTSKSATGIDFYTPAEETWTYNADYQPSVVITTNGQAKTYTAQKITETGNLYAVKGTEPTIFFKENAIASERNTNTPPTLSDYLAIVPYGENNLFFMDTSSKSPSEVVNSWNAKTGNGWYVDWNRNNKLDDADKTSHTMDVDDFCQEQAFTTLQTGLGTTTKVDTLKTYEYTKIADESKYTIVDDNTLAYATDFVILGTWYIPIEYGNITMIQHVTVPVIGDVTLPNMYEGGTSRIQAMITNTGDAGKITVRLNGVNTSHVKINDWQQNLNFEKGQTLPVLFEVTGMEVNGNLQNCLTIEAEGTTGEIATKDICFFVLDTDTEEYESSLQHIEITAVDKKGNELPDMTIEVFAQDSVQKGVWYGEVPVGPLSVSGEKKYDYNPVTTSITIEEGKEDYQFVYEQLYTGSSTADSSNTYKYLAYILLAIVVIMLVTGSYLYLSSNKKGTRRIRNVNKKR
jgi:hypothetical protein